jgi:hypothetical protein
MFICPTFYEAISAEPICCLLRSTPYSESVSQQSLPDVIHILLRSNHPSNRSGHKRVMFYSYVSDRKQHSEAVSDCGSDTQPEGRDPSRRHKGPSRGKEHRENRRSESRPKSRLLQVTQIFHDVVDREILPRPDYSHNCPGKGEEAGEIREIWVCEEAGEINCESWGCFCFLGARPIIS